MMNTPIVGLVDLCARYRWTVIIAGLLLLLGTGTYVAARFSINTDVEGLISQNLPWHQRQVELTKSFPQRAISAVISAPTAENAETATNELAQALAKNPSMFHAVVGEVLQQGYPAQLVFHPGGQFPFDLPAPFLHLLHGRRRVRCG